MGQGMHDCPGDIGVAGGVGARRAVGDLAAVGGAALDGQEGRGDVAPTGVPLDAAAGDGVLGLEHQGVLGLEAVVDRGRARVEVAHQVEHAIAHARDIDTDVLDVEALGELLDLGGLVGERGSPPGVLLQDPELAALLERRRHDNARRIVAGAAGVVAEPDGAVAEWPIIVRVVVRP